MLERDLVANDYRHPVVLAKEVATPRCPNSQCGAIIDVDLQALAGYLWSPPPPRSTD